MEKFLDNINSSKAINYNDAYTEWRKKQRDKELLENAEKFEKNRPKTWLPPDFSVSLKLKK
jgi:hypothetical protein